MKKRFLIVLTLLLLLPFPALAQTSADYIVDNADLITDSQEAELEDLAGSIADQFGIHPIIVTVNSLGGKTPEAFADDYYDTFYGYEDGVLFLLAMDTRDWAISTCGDSIYALTDYGLQSLFSSISGYLSQNDYYDAFDTYLNELPTYFQAFRDGSPIDGSQVGYTGPGTYEPGSGDHVVHYDRKPDAGDYLRIILVSLVIGAGVGGIAIAVMRGQMNTAKAQQNAGRYLTEGSYNLTRRMDVFLYSRVNRTRRVKDNGGGGGGGSSVHHSSGGRSHGGSHGKF